MTQDLYIVHLPAIPGTNLRFTGQQALRAAQREVRNATKAGLGQGAWINRVTVRAA